MKPQPQPDRDRRIVELRKSGLSYSDIAFALVEEGFERMTAEGVRQVWLKKGGA